MDLFERRRKGRIGKNKLKPSSHRRFISFSLLKLALLINTI